MPSRRLPWSRPAIDTVRPDINPSVDIQAHVALAALLLSPNLFQTRPGAWRQSGAVGDLAPAELRIHRRRAFEVDRRDIGPKYIVGVPTAVDENQHAGSPLAEVAHGL